MIPERTTLIRIGPLSHAFGKSTLSGASSAE